MGFVCWGYARKHALGAIEGTGLERISRGMGRAKIFGAVKSTTDAVTAEAGRPFERKDF